MPTGSADSAQRSKSVFFIARMDCPSEENLIRMAVGKLPGAAPRSFDLAARTVEIEHEGPADAVLAALQPLNLGAELRDSAALEASAAAATLCHSTLGIPQMDCPSEENMIRLALAEMEGIDALAFDLARRQLRITHRGAISKILARLAPLNLGAHLIGSERLSAGADAGADAAGDAAEARTLRILLAINAIMFIVELGWGLLAQSTGLVADSLDMFADAAVYGLALYAVGRAAAMKTKAAHLAGYLQLVLAIGALLEVARRAVFGSEPESALMMGIGALALIANVVCLVLIAKKRDRGAHMKASYIFSANDVIANFGVIAAGALVTWTGSPYPDLIVGTIIAAIVLSGARRILALR